ncbi:hypothetical protein EDC04DRAFT_2706106 [Pisolithus marmoratus]|nr:hypothetical protein EDC04DRAFT_2706106 [Pisolithus marmoratus]
MNEAISQALSSGSLPTENDRMHIREQERLGIRVQRLDDALRIMKLNTDQAWTEPDQYSRDGRHDPDTPRQVMATCWCLMGGGLSEHVLLQIRLEPLRAGIYCEISPNQLFRLEALLEPRLLISNFSIHSPTVTWPTVQQADGSEDTYVIKVQRKRTGNERGHDYALLNPPTTRDVGPAPDVTHQLVVL